MQASHQHQSSAAIHGFFHHPVQDFDPYGSSHFQIFDKNMFSMGSQGTTVSFQTCKEEFFTLESSTLTTVPSAYDSPANSISSSQNPFLTQVSHLCLSHHSPDSSHGSSISGGYSGGEGNALWQKLREVEILLMEPEADMNDSRNFCFMSSSQEVDNLQNKWDWNQMKRMIPKLDLKEVVVACAKAVSDKNIERAAGLMHVLEEMVSVSGNPIQRLGAYMLEGLKARLELSGSMIYKALKCDRPISSDLLTYMGLLYKICPYWRFAYESANAVIWESVQYEPQIHIIDFQIAQGSQWIPLIEAFARRPGGAPVIRITGVDDSQSAHARGGGLNIVGQMLSRKAESCNIPFEFIDVTMDGSEVQRENLMILPGEAVIVNFPYVLHHIPDESVNIWNHRDRLIRLVKSLSPKIVTLIEQESNTNTKPFFPRFLETLDYYTAMFESIDVAHHVDHKQRINAEQNCVARDIVNMIACEDAERVERHELLGKWKSRFSMAGFTQYPLSTSATHTVRNLLAEYDRNYHVKEHDSALYLFWKNRPMSTASAFVVDSTMRYSC